MLRDVRSRVRLSIGVLGCAVLLTSFVSWAHSLHTAAGQYTWVRLDPSRVPAVETAELWHVSASCVRPYFVRALLRSKAKLAAHYNAAPDEVRARLNLPAEPRQSVEPASWQPPESGKQKQVGHSDPYGEYVAALQVKYAEWYAALFKLEIEAGNWQQRLLSVADQTVVLSAASRRSFAASSRRAVTLSESQGDFDGHLLTALGLGGLSSDEQTSLKSACVATIPVMQSIRQAPLLGELWHWPVDCLAEFSFGLELVLLSIFFAPVAVWIGSGESGGRANIPGLRGRLNTTLRHLTENQLMRAMLGHLRGMQLAVLALLERRRASTARRRTRNVIAWTAEAHSGAAELRPLWREKCAPGSSRPR